jgi:hypothetical protein
MRPGDAARLRRKWRRWIKVIGDLVAQTGIDDYVFLKSMEVAARDGVVDPGNQAYQWAMRVYATHLAVGIRRLVDSSDKTYSLLCLVQSISMNPQVITRASFVRRYPPYSKHLGNAEFDSIAGKGESSLPRGLVEVDLHQLRALASRIRPFVDKVVAHRERRPRGARRLTWREKHQAIEELDRICVKYTAILNQAGMRTMLPLNLHAYDMDIQTVWGRRGR